MVDQQTKPDVTVTGFERKSLRNVIENWIYTDDIELMMDAATELRRRFKKAFPPPSWAKENK